LTYAFLLSDYYQRTMVACFAEKHRMIGREGIYPRGQHRKE
jgi:hypothetical protein